MDRNLTTKDWAKRFAFGILGIVCINAYQFFHQVVHADNRTTSSLKFFGRLADDLIKNQEGVRATRAAVVNQVASAVATTATPTVRKTHHLKRGKGGHHAQGWCLCSKCKNQTTYNCSLCTHNTDELQKQFWFCNPTTVEGSKCFIKRVAKAHAAKAHEDN